MFSLRKKAKPASPEILHTRSQIPNSVALLWIVFLLSGLGLITIYAASSMKGSQQFGDGFLFLKKQVAALLGGIVMIAAIMRLPFRLLEKLTLPVVVVSLILLVAVLIPGLHAHVLGASRWLNFGFIRFQPAELAKLALVLFLAKNLSRKGSNLNHFKTGVLPNLVAYSLFAGLLMLQPDFGTAFLLFVVTFMMLFVAGVSRKFISIATFAGLTACAVAVWVAPYRLRRLTSFMDPWSEIKEGGFQIIQSYLGFQNGGILGLGLGESKQKLYFLPEAHTDFILSVVGEELGLIGVLFVIMCFAYMTYLGIKITRTQQVVYRKFLAFGLTCLVSMQACINIGVAMGLLPTKGMTLPFVSSGASSLVIFLGVAGILARIALEGEKAPFHELEGIGQESAPQES